MLDLFRNKIVIAYTILLSALSWGVFSMEDNNTKGLLTLLNIILLAVPLISVIFSTIYLYNASEFIEMLLSQPIPRRKIWVSLFFGLVLSLSLAFILGAGIPVCLFAPPGVSLMMISVGSLVSISFISLAFLSTIYSRDKARGIGLGIMLWLFFAILFDALVLFLIFQFSDYPIEKAMVGLAVLNPIDLGRIFILLQLDVSAMMGYTGAIFKDFFGTTAGTIISFVILLLWGIVPFLISLRKFKKKDL